jgi:hypothetical protein
MESILFPDKLSFASNLSLETSDGRLNRELFERSSSFNEVKEHMDMGRAFRMFPLRLRL